eukprot:CAMPEP_0195542354 /NCGR_PEP_ID=MMETSP0794_2-20130614/51563_1 /TAXON_ID=515487 /ORGANISM="Stephanopyxis turris, Strain CCMP 815" /LENGTH=58 /DNA_ID=CAMNT_0040676485 /DNA_START=142 /DNA_END=318 /DNA_ORIENTATION=+
MADSGDLYESRKTWWIETHLALSDKPIISSAVIILTKGNFDSRATLAATADFPERGSP